MSIAAVPAAPIEIANQFNANRVVDAIVLAFSADPTVRWIYPESHQFLAEFPELVWRFSAKSFEEGSAFHTADFCGAALWFPPGACPDEAAVVEHIEESVAASLQGEVLAIFEQMDRFHPPEPHWYLSFIGVDPAYQRRGTGAALLRQVLQRCDRDQQPAYLESSNPANISLYERHGFEVVGTIQAGSSPPLFPMIRQPR